jgi:hypothetical protein
MAQRKTKKEVVTWIKKIIKSCKTSQHLKGAEKLIIQFDTVYNDYSKTRDLQNYFINFVHDNLVFKPRTK